jgi:hypothetical protein
MIRPNLQDASTFCCGATLIGIAGLRHSGNAGADITATGAKGSPGPVGLVVDVADRSAVQMLQEAGIKRLAATSDRVRTFQPGRSKLLETSHRRRTLPTGAPLCVQQPSAAREIKKIQ